MDDRNAIRFVELTGHFGNQFVGRHANRAGEARGFINTFLNEPSQHPATFSLASRHLGEIDVNLVHTAIFHERRNVCDDAFEYLGEVTVLVKVHRQQNGLRAKLGSFHEAHG